MENFQIALFFTSCEKRSSYRFESLGLSMTLYIISTDKMILVPSSIWSLVLLELDLVWCFSKLYSVEWRLSRRVIYYVNHTIRLRTILSIFFIYFKCVLRIQKFEVPNIYRGVGHRIGGSLRNHCWGRRPQIRKRSKKDEGNERKWRDVQCGERVMADTCVLSIGYSKPYRLDI